MVQIKLGNGKLCKLCLKKNEPCHYHGFSYATKIEQINPAWTGTTVPSSPLLIRKIPRWQKYLVLIPVVHVIFVIGALIYTYYMIQNTENPNEFMRHTMVLYDFPMKMDLKTQLKTDKEQLLNIENQYRNVLLNRTSQECEYMGRYIRTDNEMNLLQKGTSANIANHIKEYQVKILTDCKRIFNKVKNLNISQNVFLFDDIKPIGIELEYRDLHKIKVEDQLRSFAASFNTIPFDKLSLDLANEQLFYYRYFGSVVSSQRYHNKLNWIKSSYLSLYIGWQEINLKHEQSVQRWNKWIALPFTDELHWHEVYTKSWSLINVWLLMVIKWNMVLTILLIYANRFANKRIPYQILGDIILIYINSK